MRSRAGLLFWVTGAVAAVCFVFFDWSGYQGKFAPLTARHLSDIWWHFPLFWLVFWLAFLGLSALSDRLSR